MAVNVNNFTSVTYNSNGSRWDTVLKIMKHGVDVLAIQEAGVLPDAFRRVLTLVPDMVPVNLVGYEGLSEYIGFSEYEWNIGGRNPLYLYYGESRPGNPLEPGRCDDGTVKQNMAMVSKRRAEQLIVFPPGFKNKSRLDKRNGINRPGFGIRIANSVFFNIHPEPSRASNEAGIMVNAIKEYMAAQLPGLTWLVMGDFNRTPYQLIPELSETASDRFINVVCTARDTRESGELDYGVLGGPIALRSVAVGPIILVASILEMTENGSDHEPVIFRPWNMNVLGV